MKISEDKYDAFTSGVKAFFQGKSKEDNTHKPKKEHRELYTHWCDGFVFAQTAKEFKIDVVCKD